MKMWKNKIISLMIVVLVLIIIYLFINVKQPFIECDKKTTDSVGVTIVESLLAELDNNKIGKMRVTKKFIIPDKYLENSDCLEQLKLDLERSYEYLDDDVVKVSIGSNYVFVEIEVDDDEAIILNNVSFKEQDGLKVKINPNTKSSEVVTLKVKDKYTEGELLTRMKSDGYYCR